MEIRIRDARVEDAAGLARVRIETWRTAYRELIPAEVLAELDVEKEIQRWQESLAQPALKRHVFVAQGVAGAGVVGFCSVGANREPDDEYSGELYAIYILQAYQRLGIGRRLMQAGAGWLRAQGHARFVLWVLRDNLPARHFYEALGGQAVREHQITIRGVDLPEVGYGYEVANFQ